MNRWVVLATTIMLFVGSNLAAETGSPYAISQVLVKSHLSGSLIYSWRGSCKAVVSYPPTPFVHAPNLTKSPLESLRQMFGTDSDVKIYQDASGIVRMIEADVPTDILQVKIKHLSFEVSGSAASAFRGPNMAIRVMLSTPEVQKFLQEHQLKLSSKFWRLPNDATSDKAQLRGSLDNVTVQQVLDYICNTFPGLWLYGYCIDEQNSKEHHIYFWFLENFPK